MYKTYKKIKFFIIISGLLLVQALPLSGVRGDDAARALPVFLEQKAENERVRQELAAAYGADQFLACFKCAAGESNPFAFAGCLRVAEACLKEREVRPRICPDGQVDVAGFCVSADTACKAQFGEHSHFTGETTEKHSYVCECAEGYAWNDGHTACSLSACPADMVYYSAYRTAAGNFLHGRCYFPDEACASAYGDGSVFSRFEKGEYLCGCASGWRWSASAAACEEIPVVAGIESPSLEELVYEETVVRERGLTDMIDLDLTARLNGRILLQTEAAGEAWYLEPLSGQRIFLGSPAKAFAVMRAYGLGATHEFITGRTVFPDHVLGRILIDVEDLGRAYYIDPESRQARYLGRPADAFKVMRGLGLGISNNDIRRLAVGEAEN